MGIFDGLEKLINEHGSAVILKERIALANDKYADLEKKLADSALREKQLESEKQGFELQNLKLKEKIRNLEEKLVERHGQRLEEVREKLLVVLSAGGELQADQLAQAVGIGEQLATFHLNEMKEVRLVSAAMFYTGRPSLWCIAQEGRSYLVTHGLLT